MFDVMTGQLVNPGSPAMFFILAAIVAAGLFAWRHFDKASFNSAKAELQAEIKDLRVRVAKSAPEFVDSLQAKLNELQAKLDALLKK